MKVAAYKDKSGNNHYRPQTFHLPLLEIDPPYLRTRLSKHQSVLSKTNPNSTITIIIPETFNHSTPTTTKMKFQISHLLAGSLAILGTSAASAVIDLLPTNFDDIVLKSGKPALVEFFAPWCGHCKTLAPIYDELAGSLEYAKDKVTIAKVDADAHKDLGRRFGVQGFPTLKWFDGKSETPSEYSSGRDLESLQAFVADKTGVKPKGKKAAHSDVVMLDDASFKKEIGGDKDVLVAFTAPWCGREFFPFSPSPDPPPSLMRSATPRPQHSSIPSHERYN